MTHMLGLEKKELLLVEMGPEGLPIAVGGVLRKALLSLWSHLTTACWGY